MAIATNVVANGSSTTAGVNVSSSYVKLYKVNNSGIMFNNLATGGEVYTDLIARESIINALRLVGALNVYWLQTFSNDYPITGGVDATCFLAVRAHLERMNLAPMVQICRRADVMTTET
jgi:hypothetical protein